MARWIGWIVGRVALLIMLATAGCSESKVPPRTAPEVTIIYPVTVEALQELGQGARDVLAAKGIGLRVLSAEGDPGRFSTAADAAVSGRPNAIIAVGTQVTNTLLGGKYVKTRPPIVAAAIFEPEKLEGLSHAIAPPRAIEIAVVSDHPPKVGSRLIALVRSMIPNGRKIGILTNRGEQNSIDSADAVAQAARAAGLEVDMAYVTAPSDLVASTKALIIRGADVLIIPHDKIAVAQAAAVVEAGISTGARKVPVFSLDDGTVAQHGVLASVSADYRAVGRRAGELAAQAVAGQSLRDVPIIVPPETVVAVNKKTAGRLGLSLPDAAQGPVRVVE